MLQDNDSFHKEFSVYRLCLRLLKSFPVETIRRILGMLYDTLIINNKSKKSND